MKLTVDRSAKQHYRDETAKAYFSISQGLKCLDPDQYAGIPPDVLEQAARRGTAVHYFFARLMYSRAGVCPVPEILPQYEGQCRGLLAWAEATKPEPLLIETSSVWEGRDVAGTPDLLCLYGLKNVPTLIELKTTSQAHVTHKLQVNIQKRLKAYTLARYMRLLYVEPDGSYKDVPVEPDPHGEAAFINMIQVMKWRLNR